MKKFYFYLFLFLCFFNKLNGQGFSKIEGVVLEKSTNLPLSNVYISIPANGIGTSTNEVGQFVFKFPSILQNQKISISALDFNNLILDLGDSLTAAIDTFFLERHIPVVLDTTYSNHQKPNWLIADALLRVKANAQMNNYMLNGFYQETLYRDSLFVKIYEGLLRVEKNPTPPQRIPDDFLAEKVKLVKGRKYEKPDFTEELKDFGFGNGPAIVVHSIEISLPEYFEGRNLNDYKFELDSVLSFYNDKPLWVLRFVPVLDRKVKAAREGKVYIDTLNKAIVRIEYEFTSEGTKDVVKGTLKNVLGGLKTDVKKVSGAYQYNNFNGKSYLIDSRLELNAFIKKGKDFKTEASIKLHYITSEILTRYSPIKSTDVLESVDEFQYGGKFYKDAIWGNFNFKVPTEEMKNIIIIED